MRHEIKADRGSRRALQCLADLDQVAERLAHLATFVSHKSGVHPCARKWRLARERFGLRTLGLVMAELQVPAAAVDVDLRAKVVHRHHGAFDVPSGAPLAKFRGPRRLIWR